MKKFIAAIALVLLAACTQTGGENVEQNNTVQSGSMCEKCPCCQKMKEGGAMKGGMQCPMMQGNKDGKSCACCEKMMMNKSVVPTTAKDASKPSTKTGEGHEQHHPKP